MGSDTNRTVQPHKMTRGLKFQTSVEKGLRCNICIEKKGADQQCSNREADLRLCFRIYAKSNVSKNETQNTPCSKYAKAEKMVVLS